MSIRVMLFGPFAEPFPERQVEVKDVVTTNELEACLKSMHAVFQDYSIRIAINRKIVDADTTITATDEVAVLPPFSGG
ncbi:MAG: MoaD/ThiS family protein [Bacteroidota bacterium]